MSTKNLHHKESALKSAITIRSLTKRYGNITAVDDISLSIEQGDFYGFIGPNGAGKTTTIKSMLNLLKINEGGIEIFGENVDKNLFQEDIGYVPGEANLYDNLKVGDQIKYFARYYPNIDTGYLKHIKGLFAVDENKRIAQLSLGNKKKVAIICALMNQPKLLIFDEVSNSLDPLMQKNLFEELKRLNQAGVTIFFSSHNLEEVQTYCRNVAIIREGKIIRTDNVEKIVASMGVRVTIKTKQKLNPGFFSKHKITHHELSNAATTFVYKGDINELVFYASKYKLESMRIADVKLEDIFGEFYEKRKQ